jgi:ATP-dependent RNA helicase RhlE
LRLNSIQKLVIDEVDEMLNLGFRTQLVDIMDLLPERRQNLMFSATLSEDIDMLINTFFHLPVKVEVTPSGTPLDKIVQQAYHVPNFFTKVNLLTHLLQNNEEMSKVLVFVASKQLADKLHEKMSAILEDNVGVIHSNKSQNQRFNAIERFENGTLRMLIATDIIARGLDIKEVTHVINFDTPENATSYIHRIGRTGRADKHGIAITFINEVEQAYQIEIEDMMQQLIPVLPLPKDVEISSIFTDDEKPQFLGDKNYLKQHKITHSQGAFHEKKDKNAKVNLGGSYRRKLKEKYKKPIKKGGSKKKK